MSECVTWKRGWQLVPSGASDVLGVDILKTVIMSKKHEQIMYTKPKTKYNHCLENQNVFSNN